MELIQARLANPAIIVWIAVAAIGLGVSLIALAIMRYEVSLRPWALSNPTVRAMKSANQIAEAVRLGIEMSALGIAVAYVFGGVSGTLIVWVLVVMNLGMVVNSTNELLLTVSTLGGWRVVMRELLRRRPRVN